MICTRCLNDLPTEKFHIAGRRKDGTPILRKYCAICYSIVKAKRATKLKTWYQEYKRTLECYDCHISFKECPWLCEFHHINDDKEHTIGNMAGGQNYGKEAILKEISKCQPLCCNCHRTRHYVEKTGVEPA